MSDGTEGVSDAYCILFPVFFRKLTDRKSNILYQGDSAFAAGLWKFLFTVSAYLV